MQNKAGEANAFTRFNELQVVYFVP